MSGTLRTPPAHTQSISPKLASLFASWGDKAMLSHRTIIYWIAVFSNLPQDNCQMAPQTSCSLRWMAPSSYAGENGFFGLRGLVLVLAVSRVTELGNTSNINRNTTPPSGWLKTYLKEGLSTYISIHRNSVAYSYYFFNRFALYSYVWPMEWSSSVANKIPEFLSWY